MIIPQNGQVLIRKIVSLEEKSGMILMTKPKAVEAEVIETDSPEVKKGDIVLVFTSTGVDLEDGLCLINIEEILGWMKSTKDS